MPSRKRQTANVMIRRQALTRYQELLDDQATKASAYIRSAVDAFMANNPNASTAETRDFVVRLMQAALPNFTDLAETLSCEFMQELCDAYGWDDVRPTVHDTTDYKKVESRIRYLARVLTNDDDVKFKDDVAEVTAYFVRRSAQDNMIQNCKDAEIRFARVPSGLETCAFCFMLASRGFVYWSEKSAGSEHAFHPHCTCTIVPGAKGRTKIDGYDPAAMYRSWKSCEEAVGGRRQLRKDWDALTDEERLHFIEKHPMKSGRGFDESAAFNEYAAKRVMDEVATRDWHWLYTGEPPVQDYSLASRDSYGRFIKEPDRTKRPDPADYTPENIDFTQTNKDGEWRDLFAHDVLRWNGFGITARPKHFSGPDGKIIQGASSPDISMEKTVWGLGHLWEIKSPEQVTMPEPGKELYFIGNAFEEAKRRNFKRPYDPETNEPVEDWDGELRVVLNLRYRQTGKTHEEILSKIRSQMDYWEVEEVIYINELGEVFHLKR